MKKGLRVADIIKLIPENVLDKLAEKTQVDRHVKKLSGKSLFQLFVFSLLSSERMSLRVMENYYQSEHFKTWTGEDKGATKHTSLSDRLRTIQASYFEAIFHYLMDAIPQTSKHKKRLKITRFDSTLIRLSSQLLQIGLPTQKGKYREIKFTVALEDIPKQLKVFIDKSAVGSEEIALKNAILNHAQAQEGIILFDRGIRSRKTYKEIDEQAIQFITRLRTGSQYQMLRHLSHVQGQQVGDLQLEQDIEILLAQRGLDWLAPKFRLIIASAKEGKEMLYFLTNNRTLPAAEIAELYKRRWDIEVFFRFIKQELNAKHFVSRDLNGISVILYMIMIVAIMLLIYKLSNNLSGFKLVKLHFKQELEVEIMKDIILFCGGDPTRLADRWRVVS